MSRACFARSASNAPEHIPTACGRSAGPGVRHDDFFEADPADPPTRRAASGSAGRRGFFRQHLT